ncbi:AlbA family DNA-binding domain-containing protein [Pontibacter actiniarum]|uniref:Schlafen AlbA-2 domain-containing protein n=1 Tax=Pontibacter actiniarum TaxID=323450 RepID=A0A1X9YYF6_9BACT|nr:ATP-binding protein [Pontibacter actiniarum]ARS37986.1 hypothetical protein CA264_20755 [Pontibacter actiniarum]
MLRLKQIIRSNRQWVWVVSGAVSMLFVLAPILLVLVEYHLGRHRLPLKEVVLNFYNNSLSIDLVSGLIMMAFLSTGGALGYLLFRSKIAATHDKTNDKIEDLLVKGECATIEFKSSFRWDYRLLKTSKEIELASLKTIAAFMNSEGGTLLIGVADDTTILGLDKDYQSLKKGDRDGFEQYIMQSISLYLGTENCKNLKVSFVLTNNNDVCMIQVNSTGTPVFLKHQQHTHFYIRTGNGTRELDIQDALKYIKG